MRYAMGVPGILTVVILALGTNEACAWRPALARRRHADKNKDGVVTPHERALERRWETRQRVKVNSAWERTVDADHDGWVEPAEVRAWRLGAIDANHDGLITAAEERTYWVNWKSVVDTPLERKYDVNNNGLLEWVEARTLLQDRLRLIETDGRALADSGIERAFDADGNGLIDPEEANAIREALN